MPKIPTFTSQASTYCRSSGAVKSNIQLSTKSSLAGALLPAANAVTELLCKRKRNI